LAVIRLNIKVFLLPSKFFQSMASVT
jgi:hypothetical protein